MVAPTRALKCILDSRFGGPHRRSYAIADRLRRDGIETIFLFGSKGSEDERTSGFESIYLKHLQFMRRRHAVTNLLLFLLYLPWNVIRIRRIIRSQAITVVDVDGVTNPVPALAAALSGVPIVWHYNDHLPGPLRRVILYGVAALSSTVIVQGQRLKTIRTQSSARLRDKTVVIYPGVDTEKFDPTRYDAAARNRLRRQFGIPADSPLIGIIGNVNRFKGHTYFIKAAGRIKEQIAAAKFIIVGRKLDTAPECWNDLQRLTAELGLENDVIYTGFQDDIPALLSILDMFVLSSTLESCPNVLLEAMAMEVPVVATDVGAVAELVLDGRTGTVVPPGDAEAIARAVVAALRDSEGVLGETVAAARKRVESTFELGRIAYRQREVYETANRRHIRHT